MAKAEELRVRLKHLEVTFDFEEVILSALREQGFRKTLKSLRKGRLPGSELYTVIDGVVEELPSGCFEAALQTDKGRLVLSTAHHASRISSDPQVFVGGAVTGAPKLEQKNWGPKELLQEFQVAGKNPPHNLVCAIELTSFGRQEREDLLPLLWQYILHHRDSNNTDELIAVASAIRKYAAIMPMSQMDSLATLLEDGHRSVMPIELEIELAKMICRNFEVHPPAVPEPYPELSERLWEIAQAYLNPRVLLRDKYATAASLAIESIISMRSLLSEDALNAALSCSHKWFGELVADNIEALAVAWKQKNNDAADWVNSLIQESVAKTMPK